MTDGGRPRALDGKGPGGAEELPALRAARQERAISERLGVRLVRGVSFGAFDVRNPTHRTEHRVVLPRFPEREPALCSCADFSRRGLGTCKHVEAVAQWLERRPTPVALPRPRQGSEERTWEAIDRTLESARQSPGVAPAVRLRRAGALLMRPPDGASAPAGTTPVRAPTGARRGTAGSSSSSRAPASAP